MRIYSLISEQRLLSEAHKHIQPQLVVCNLRGIMRDSLTTTLKD